MKLGHSRILALGVLAGVLVMAVQAEAATPEPKTLRAWEAYVAATETRIARELASPRGFLVSDFSPARPDVRARLVAGDIVVDEMATTVGGGTSIVVPDGRIAHWRGAVFLPGVHLDTLLDRLQHPSERGPHQEDVLALRVLERRPDVLKMYIRMTRTKVVTVTYDTEHVLAYHHHRQGRASSRSVATKIVELDGAGTALERRKLPGEDRGFMWRLNSYWRYEQVEGGVIVELESLTLSRGIPRGLAFLVEPIIDRVARESIGRTLENLRRAHTPAMRVAAHQAS